jgi:hypothetical protein
MVTIAEQYEPMGASSDCWRLVLMRRCGEIRIDYLVQPRNGDVVVLDSTHGGNGVD